MAFERLRGWLGAGQAGAAPAPKIPEGEVAYSWLPGVMGPMPKYNMDALLARRGWGIYRQMLLDDQLGAAFEFLLNSITGRDWGFELESETLPEAERQRRIELAKFTVNALAGSWQDALNAVQGHAMRDGYSLTEKVYTLLSWKGRTWVGLKALKARPAHTFIFTIDPYGNVVKVDQLVGGVHNPVELERLIYLVHAPDVDITYGQSALLRCYDAWFSKTLVRKFRNIWLERSAGGFVWAQMQDGYQLQAGSKQAADLKNILTHISAKTGILLPQGVDLHVEWPKDQPAFHVAIADDNRAMARALLVPDLLGLTEQQARGSMAQSVTHLAAFLQSLTLYVHRLQEALDEQLWRDLNRRNFGDDEYPHFVLRPLNWQQILELAQVWGMLVNNKAVIASESDEAYLRDLLGLPEKTGPEIGEGGGAPASGAEVPGNRGDVAPMDPGAALPGGEGNPGAQPPAGNPAGGAAGRALPGLHASLAELTRAVQRVDFAVIDRHMTRAEDATVRATGTALWQGIDALVHGAGLAALKGKDAVAAAKLSWPAPVQRAIQQGARQGLQQAWNDGRSSAEREIAKAKGTARHATIAPDEQAAQRFLEGTALQMAGDLSEAARTIISQVIGDGIRDGLTTGQVVQQVYVRLARKGLLGEEAQAAIQDELQQPAREALAKLLGTSNPDARLRTVARTNVTEAFNDARYSYFSDPSLQGFVQAMEYSAILDAVTTEICRSLNGDTWPLDSELWRTYRPPNHFNCRSTLIAVTERDAWTESPAPRVQPQEGFGAA